MNFQTQKYIKILFYSIFGQRKKYQNNFQTQKFINKFFFSFLLIFLSKFQIFERKCDFYNSVNQFFFLHIFFTFPCCGPEMVRRRHNNAGLDGFVIEDWKISPSLREFSWSDSSVEDSSENFSKLSIFSSVA